jgi:large subunit ribosomal protein L3
LGFAGFKAGMTHVQYLDNSSNSPTYGKLISKAATILDAPSLFVAAVRFYSGSKVSGELWTDKIPVDIHIEKKGGSMKEVREAFDDVRLIVCTQPEKSGMHKRKPDLFELAIGGEAANNKKEYALSLMGKEISAREVFKSGEYVDVSSVTKGHGFTGVVKRFGVRIGTRKSKQAHRHTGSVGPTTPSHILHTVPLAGQYGFFTRTEFGKRILMVEEDAKKINPKGGLLGYGLIPKSFMLIEGSVPGPRKRLVRLRKSIRSTKFSPAEIRYISLESKQGV